MITDSLKMPEQIEQQYVLVVEGKDEAGFFKALIKHLGLENIEIRDIGGKKKSKENLRALKQAGGFSNVISLGIVRDADSDADSVFKSVCSDLAYTQLPVPKRPLEFVGSDPRVGIMILPVGNRDGMLEDVCLKSVQEDSVIPCVNEFFRCLEKRGVSHPKNKISKAKVQVFLSSKAEPGKQLGVAAQCGYWPLDNEAFNEVKRFLTKFRQ